MEPKPLKQFNSLSVTSLLMMYSFREEVIQIAAQETLKPLMKVYFSKQTSTSIYDYITFRII